MSHRDPTTSQVQKHTTSGEEIANSVSHAVGLLGALAAAPIIIVAACSQGEARKIIAVSIFAVTMVLLYTCSMMYHGLAHGRGKQVFLHLDHIAIYFLIAGTYTPFALCTMRGMVGDILLALIWGCALLGTCTQVVPKFRHPTLSVALYLVMGWVILFFIQPLYHRLALNGLLWLLAGGIAYTCGVYFYLIKARYAHFVWHLFTIAGTTCHFFAVLWYVV